MKNALKRRAGRKRETDQRKPVMNVFVSGLNHFGDLICLKSALDKAKITYYWMNRYDFETAEQDWPARLYIGLERMDLVLDVLRNFELHVYNADEFPGRAAIKKIFTAEQS